MKCVRMAVRGVVQGVGFRPFVYTLAERFTLNGWVLNNSSGVTIEVEGPADQIEGFLSALQDEAPPLAHIESLDVQDISPVGYTDFQIRHSERQEGAYQLVSPDMATCPDCLRELLDPADRRYRYAFTNCTNCGPRFTIIRDIPYDRPSTTMDAFRMCPDCQREYDDPYDRRFHAQPNACPVCGPQVQLVSGDASSETVYATRNTEHEPDPLSQAAHLLCEGAILAIKGLGGFHLACDATNTEAVQRLRERKQRPHKPFAVMIASLDEIRQHCQVRAEEETLLTSPQCPIVLLSWRDDSTVVGEVAPGYQHLGVMLPYTPLHHVLLRDVGRPLVMTSGNLTEEPIAAENEEAQRRLGHLADAFLLHNRDIYARYDDSVWCVPEVSGELARPYPIRRARGYAPFPIKVPFQMAPVLACGAELKNTFCLTRDQYAFVSQHVGDMENLETLEHYERTVELYEKLFRVRPQAIVHDLHPDYMATKYGISRGSDQSVQLVPVQHHHAHLAACLADNGWAEENGPVIGVVMDGTGLGHDGHIWGGEWLVGGYREFRRAAQIEYLPLPGGDAATRHPWRIAYGYLYALLGQAPDHILPDGVEESQVAILRQQIDRGLNCPLTSSMGRLFDAVSALLGVCTETSYEAQAAIELEGICNSANLQMGKLAEGQEKASYPFWVEQENEERMVRLKRLFAALLADVEGAVPASKIARRFHETVAGMIVEVCTEIRAETGLDVVALSGGCFQNRLLLRLTVPGLRDAGFEVLVHRQVPCNDGGLSLGQAAIAHHVIHTRAQHTELNNTREQRKTTCALQYRH